MTALLTTLSELTRTEIWPEIWPVVGGQFVLSDVVLVVPVSIVLFVGFAMCCFIDFLYGCKSLALGIWH